MPALPTRKIGGQDVSAMGFGLMGLSTAYVSVPDSDEERFKILDHALEKGCTFWDTAAVYGDNEDLVGKWFKRTGKRDQIFLATKGGVGLTGADGSAANIRASFEQSAKRLGVDHVDLYYAHRADPNTPIEITVGAMAELVKEGKVRHIGLSEISAATLRRAYAVHPIAAVEIEYSPFFLDIEDPKIGLLKACRELGVTVVAYSPLGRGLLTGTFKSNADIPDDDWRKAIPKFSQENFPNILKLVAGLQALGKKHNATAGQVILSWILAQGEDFIPIPGTRRIKYLDENLAALNLKLSKEELEQVRKIAAEADAVHGDRYPTIYMASMWTDTPAL